jgi:hypothetical protein
MAGKTNTSATFFAQKKLLGKAHTSNLKTDGEELIGSNIQAASSFIFGEEIPTSPSLSLYTIQSSSAGSPGTVEYIPFILNVLTGTTYDANALNPDGGAGSDDNESNQIAGPHAYKFVLPSDYEEHSLNARSGNGYFNNNRIVHETLGKVQLIPPFFSQNAPNPYIVKIYKDNGAGAPGEEIPLLDNIDWNVDYYNGILFLQDYKSDKIPAHARAFAYVGKMADEVISSGVGGSGSISSTDEIVVAKTSANIPGGKVLIAGAGIEIDKTSNSLVISSPSIESSRKKLTFFMTQSISAGTPIRVLSSSFEEVNNDAERIDVIYNGQLLHSGSSEQVSSATRDYYITNTDYLVFSFPVFEDDIVDTIVNRQKHTTFLNAADINAEYIVLSSTGSLPYHRVLTGSNGIVLQDGGPGQNIEIKLQKAMVFNEVLSGSADGSNTQFSLRNTPFHTGSVSVFVNGQLQTPHYLNLDFYDYFITGSNIYFSSSSIPQEKSVLLTIYEKIA